MPLISCLITLLDLLFYLYDLLANLHYGYYCVAAATRIDSVVCRSNGVQRKRMTRDMSVCGSNSISGVTLAKTLLVDAALPPNVSSAVRRYGDLRRSVHLGVATARLCC